jgi:hypothetical protein
MVLMLFCLGAFPATAEDKDREKMMWRGTITMEIIERHDYEIEKTNPISGRWSNRIKHSDIYHIASIRVISADPLGNGDVEVSGPVSSERHIIEEVRSRDRCRSGYSVERIEGVASGDLKQGGLVKILFMKKSQVENAENLVQAIQKCGTDTACLAKAYESLAEDQSASFPIQMIIQCIPKCKGTDDVFKQSVNKDCNGEIRREEDSAAFPIFCRQMAVEIKDGTYTRGKQGDRITGTFFKSELIPYTGPDGQIYPIETIARCVVNLTNGPPELKIYMATENGYADITDKEQDILVGQKVNLSAHVVSTGLGEESQGKWKIPGKIVKEWMGRPLQSYRWPVKDLTTSTIGFAWYRGKTGGEKRTVKYEVKFGKKTLKAKTNFKVYAPEVSRVDVKPGQDVEIVNVVDPDTGEIRCELIGGNPAMEIQSVVKLTGPFSGQRFCLFYVQKIISKNCGLERKSAPHYEWLKDVHDWKLDSNFPYNGYKCAVGQNRITMMDTPGFPLSKMASAYAHMAFEDYLMFIPPMPKTYAGICPVPLKKVKWGWSGSAIATGDTFPRSIPPCGQGHRPRCKKPPKSCNPRISEAEEYPSWEGFVAGTKPMPTREHTTTRSDPPPPRIGWTCGCE